MLPLQVRGLQFNTGDGIKMVEDVGAKLWHMDMAISMYSMWTRDPENDFSILYFMPANSYFNVNRLGKRYVNENNMGSPHNGWHTLLSFDDSIDDFDRIPSWGIFDQTCFDAASCPPARAISSSAATSPATCRRDPRMERLEPGQQGRAGEGLDPQGRHHRGAWQEDQGVRPLDGRRRLESHVRRVPGILRGKEGRAFDRSEKTLEKLDDGPYYAISIYPAPAPPWAAR